jgi:hypothetical protein
MEEKEKQYVDARIFKLSVKRADQPKPDRYYVNHYWLMEDAKTTILYMTDLELYKFERVYDVEKELEVSPDSRFRIAIRLDDDSLLLVQYVKCANDYQYPSLAFYMLKKTQKVRGGEKSMDYLYNYTAFSLNVAGLKFYNKWNRHKDMILSKSQYKNLVKDVERLIETYPYMEFSNRTYLTKDGTNSMPYMTNELLVALAEGTTENAKQD